MTKSPCDHYTPWTDHGLQIRQCLEFWEGFCNEAMSPHYKQDCPWPNGYPCGVFDGEGTWKPPEAMLRANVAAMDDQVED
jgi:hypothetical protein